MVLPSDVPAWVSSLRQPSVVAVSTLTTHALLLVRPRAVIRAPRGFAAPYL